MREAEPCSSTPLAAAMGGVVREVPARMVSAASVFTTGLGTPILRGLQINWKIVSDQKFG